MFKFPLCDFTGTPKSFYLVQSEVLTSGKPSTGTKAPPSPTHLVFIVDASGSMWGDMSSLKSTLIKLLTLEEYRDSTLNVSVLSFASSGDLITHINHVPVSTVMQAGSSYLTAIQNLQTRGCTCITQGLAQALTLVQANELTAVVLLSDGYANDRSPGAEKREIDVLVEKYNKLPNVFLNTIAFREWADYKLLSYMANAGSGTCFQCPSSKEVYDVLHNTGSLLSGPTQPAITVARGPAAYVTAVSLSGQKTLGTDTDTLSVRGLSDTDDLTVYRYQIVTQAAYDACKTPVASAGNPGVLAYSLAQLSEGNLNTAKYALVSSQNETLLTGHARALTNTEVAAMSTDICSYLYDPAKTYVVSKGYGLPNANEQSVLGILAILAEGAQAGEVSVDVAALSAGYKRRGVRRVTGSREADGSILKPWIKTASRSTSKFTRVNSFDLNRNNATVNMLVSGSLDLVDTTTNAVIDTVAGIRLDVKSYNNYTIVGDGTLNVDTLTVQIGSKKLFRQLQDAGVIASAAVYAPDTGYLIQLAGRPLVAYNSTFDPSMLDGVFMKLARAKVLSSILSSSLKGESDKYTPEQVAELKRHYLSPAMYVSLPTTTEYADKNAALTDGTIDTRLSYKVDFGTSTILNMAELYSANEFLARHFTVTIAGLEQGKPKFEQRWQDKVSYGYKTLSSRTKINAVDNLMKPMFEEFLGLKQNGSIRSLLAELGLSRMEPDVLPAVYGQVSSDLCVEFLTDLSKKLDAAIEKLYTDRVSPFVFYVGSTGLIPDEFQAKGQTAEQIKVKYPDLSVGGKDAADATFYEVGMGTIVSVFSKQEFFSTGKSGPVSDADAVI